MIATRLNTLRLTLLPASADHLRAELADTSTFGALVGAAVPASWPPGEYDEPAQRFFLECLTASGDAGVGWYCWYAVRSADGETPATVVGSGGYFGPPTPEGVVELGYSVCPEWRGHGYATELARALAAHALQQRGVELVIAHTTAANAASVTVLKRSGFAHVGAGAESATLRFEYRPHE